MTNRERIPAEVVVVDEEVLGYALTSNTGRTFYPLAFNVKGSTYYASSSPVMLGEANRVRSAVLADEEKFRIHLAAYGITE